LEWTRRRRRPASSRCVPGRGAGQRRIADLAIVG
jgi:hypothetical protein